MRKLIPIFSVLSLIVLLSMNDYDACSGLTMNAACSACHAGSIADGVFLPGKTEDDSRLNNNEYQVTVRIPTSDVAVLQINTIVEEEIPGKVEIDLATTLIELKDNSLFAISDLFQRKSDGSETEDVTVHFTFDEALKESQKIIVQGVMADGDGTVEGDVAFYKEITLEPKENSLSSSDLSVISNGISYFPHQEMLEVVSLDNTKLLRIVDLQGKVVLQEQIESYSSVELSSLEKGYYIAVLGTPGKNMETYKFMK